MFGAFVLMSSLIQAAVAPQPGEEAIKLKAVIGYNGNGRGNMVWSADQGPYNPLKAKQKTSYERSLTSHSNKQNKRYRNWCLFHACFKKKNLKRVVFLPIINFCCRFVCVLVWLRGGGGVPAHRKSETPAGPQRGDLLSSGHK